MLLYFFVKNNTAKKLSLEWTGASGNIGPHVDQIQSGKLPDIGELPQSVNDYCDFLRLPPTCHLNGRKQTDATTTKKKTVLANHDDVTGHCTRRIAHDLSNVLQPVIGSLQILIADTSHDRPLKKKLEKILAGTYRSGDLVKLMLNQELQEASGIPAVRIQPVIRAVVRLVRSTLPAGMNITQAIDRDCGPVHADPIHIYLIVMNLISHAFHSIGSHSGTLEISLKEVYLDENMVSGNLCLQQGYCACLCISESGVGVKIGTHDMVPGPCTSLGEKEGGIGSGLFITRRIIKKYGGDICVSTNPDKVIEFQIYLPLEQMFIEPSPDKMAGKYHDLSGNETILLVGNDPVIVESQKKALLRYGYFVTSSYNGHDALEKFKAVSGEYDVVICDQELPVITGLDLAESIKQIQPDIPVIVCTGPGTRINTKQVQHLGVGGILEKPVATENCLGLVRQMLTSSRVSL